MAKEEEVVMESLKKLLWYISKVRPGDYKVGWG